MPNLNAPAHFIPAIVEDLRWCSVAPLALIAMLLAASITGCKSTQAPAATSGSPTKASVTYPARTTTTPPPFKLFHTTDNSLTLVTSESATDEQVEAIVWQLHDAAHTHSFDKLHLPQAFIAKRDPIVFIHIYRGTKCAAEKYAAGDPPCGGSYHAAGDYTLGSFANKDRDDGVLLHDENHQVELWNPDTATH